MKVNPVLFSALMTAVAVAAATPARATGSFEPVPIAPDRGIMTFDRETARRTFGRDLLGSAWGGVVLVRTDVYDRFPYVESRTFQIVSDPEWNRLLVGDTRGGFSAWDGADATIGPLSEPRGLALGGPDRLYVCDTGHDRVVIVRVESEFDDVTLTPIGAVGGLSRPYAVAVSDGGTPDDAADDRLYVTEAGRNRVALVALGATPRVVATLGGLGSGANRFAGPLAIAVGREGGRNTSDVYVADAHSRRIVRLHDAGDRLDWVGEATAPYALVTGLDTDANGTVYAAGPAEGAVARLSPRLEFLAEVRIPGSAPRQFKLVQAVQADHRPGAGGGPGMAAAPARGVAIGGWSDGSGLSLWRLRPEATGLGAPGPDRLVYRLTDRARVALALRDHPSGTVAWQGDLGDQAAGAQEVDLRAMLVDTTLPAGRYAAELHVRPAADEARPADSAAEGGALVATTMVEISGSIAIGGGGPRLLAPLPNPVRESTRLRVVLPGADGSLRTLGGEMFDAAGRRVRRFEPLVVNGGVAELPWDGRDDAGHRVPSGIYFYRLEAGGTRLTGQLVVTR